MWVEMSWDRARTCDEAVIRTDHLLQADNRLNIGISVHATVFEQKGHPPQIGSHAVRPLRDGIVPFDNKRRVMLTEELT
eukprot:385571-Prymnesium_polylepis.1